MSWEAFRWTAKSPSELYHVLGPHGVDELVRQSLSVCWRESPAEGRSLKGVMAIAQEVFDRNMSAWAKIKQPSPAAFFDNLLPRPADQFMRQAMVLCWMMMPRTGGRDVAEVRRIVGELFRRNLDAWEQDDATFTGSGRKKKAGKKPVRPAKPAKTTARKSDSYKRGSMQRSARKSSPRRKAK
jgi:hypothetical protein